MRLLLCVLLLAARVLADGGYVPRTGTLAPVEIPGQTAILAHHDGEETLTVWNTVKTDSAELAWVLPLPAAPSLIQQTDPRPIRALRIATAPRVSLPDMHPALQILLPGALVVSALLLGVRRHLREHSFHGCITTIGAGFLFFVFLGWLVHYFLSGGLMSLKADPAGSVSDLQVLSQQMTGSYETTVIKGSSALAVSEWLGANGFPPLAGDQLTAAQEYTGKGWVFLCAKLKATTGGAMAAHPLTVKFAAEAPIYPMRLTRSAGPVSVQLFVFSDSEPVVDPSGRLEVQWDEHRSPRRAIYQMRAWMEYARGGSRDDLPGIPANRDALLDAMCDSQCATCLTGTFTPASDWSDVKITAAKFPLPLPGYATRGALFMEGVSSYLLPAGLAVVLLALAGRLRAAPGKRPHWGWLAVGLCVLSVAVGLAAREAFPPGDVSPDGRRVLPSEAVTLAGKAEDPFELTQAWIESLAGYEFRRD